MTGVQTCALPIYAPGEVIDVFDGKLVVRTVDGSLLIDRYACVRSLQAGDILV